MSPFWLRPLKKAAKVNLSRERETGRVRFLAWGNTFKGRFSIHPLQGGRRIRGMRLLLPTLLLFLAAAPSTSFLTPALIPARSALSRVNVALAPRLGRSSGKETLRCAVGPESEGDEGEATAGGQRWGGATDGVQGRRALMRSAPVPTPCPEGV